MPLRILLAALLCASTQADAQFLCLDIISDELPDGDLCLLREVLQHLSNREMRLCCSK